jgi:hypothetical protein
VHGVGDDTANVDGRVKAGDRIVALGAHLLHEGQAVRLGGSAARLASAANPGDQQ